MKYLIRDATSDDHPALAEVYNSAHPADVLRITPELIRHLDTSVEPKYNLVRYALEVKGRVVGAAVSRNMIAIYHPQKFFLSLVVHPDMQRRGLGRALYDHITANLNRHDPISYLVRCRADMAPGLRFLDVRGYREKLREWESYLLLDECDLDAYADIRRRVAEQGIVIRALRELLATGDRSWEHGLYDLIMHVQADMPTTGDPFTPYGFEQFRKLMWDSPMFYPEAYFVAMDGDRFVGVSILERDLSNPKHLSTDDTGVHRDYRRRGIALALKVQAIEFAKDAGYESIRTENDATNHAMLAINERLGFKKLPAWIGLVCDLNI